MQYPIWEVPLIGGGMVIAIISIVHVVVAHFAVGAGLFVAVTETKALARNNQLFLRFLKDFSWFLVLVSFVFGAITGVGIWFSIALVSPEATSALIHQFVWGWATEWVFFIVEIVAGYIYYYTWDKMDPKKHVIIGWIYAISAFMSLVIINGILTFMLTPGEWLETRDFWDGFLNPTYWPSLALRTISALSLAAIFVAIAANLAKGYTREERHQIISEGALWLVPLALMIPVSLWYFNNVPDEARELVQGGAIAMLLMFMFGVATSTLIGLYAYFGLILKKRYINLETSILIGLIAFISTGAMEFVREGIRKPYIIREYVYSNGFFVEDSEKLQQEGVLPSAPWVAIAVQGSEARPSTLKPELQGKALYRAQCLRCHTLDGFNAMRPLVKRLPKDLIREELKNLHVKKYYMPPFFGTNEDLEALTEYLDSLKDIDNETAMLSTQQPESGEEKRS
jgi:cytochrome d ubiquinol oxidase subunit I